MKETPSSIEEALFEQAVGIPSASERAAFLDESCQGNLAWRARLELLLEGHFASKGFLTELPERPSIPERPVQSKGRYTLLEKIGEGGFGEVWLAEQREPVKRRVALKILKPGMDTRQVVARFEAERQTLALMDHPNIAKILDAGTVGGEGAESQISNLKSEIPLGRPYFVMELVRGTRITDFCEQNQLPTRERLQLFVLVCQAIQHAHQKGIIHRDIKPSNVLVTQQVGPPAPKVIDFGIAKAIQQELTDQTVFTQLHQFMGTPAYISPEQAETSGRDIDTRSDIYSLGVLLYELLVGSTPFDAREMMSQGLDAMRRTIREKAPVRPSTKLNQSLVAANRASVKAPASGQPATEEEIRADLRRRLQVKEAIRLVKGDLDWIVMRCLEKDRNRRYETANGLAADVQRHLANEPIVARPPSSVYRMTKLVRRNPVVSGLAGLLFLGLMMAVILGASMNLRLSRAKGESNRANRQLSETVRFLESEKLEQLAAAGRPAQLVAWLAGRLRDEPADWSAATRLLSLLQSRSFALPLSPPLAHDGKVTSAWFGPGGSEILTASEDGTVRFWDPRQERALRILTNAAGVLAAGHFAGGKRLLVLGRDRVTRAYDATGQTLLYEWPKRHHPEVAVFEGGGGRWFMQLQANSLSRWDLLSGAPLEPAINFSSRIAGFANCDAAACVAIYCEDRTVQVFDQASGVALAPSRQFEQTVQSVRFTPDGGRLFVSLDGGRRIVIWDWRDGGADAEFIPPPPARAHTMHFTPDGRFLLTATWDTPLRIWDTETFQPVAEPIEVGLHPGLLLSHDGRRAASLSQIGVTCLIDVPTGRMLLEPIKHQGGIGTVMFNSNDTQLVTASMDGTARLWDIRMRTPTSAPLVVATGGSAAAFSRSGDQIILSVEPYSVRVFDTPTGRPLSPLLSHPGEGEAGQIRQVAFSPDESRILTIGAGGLLRVWDAASFELRLELVVGNSVTAARFSPDGQLIVVGDRAGFATVWSAHSGQQLAAIDHNGHEVISLNFHPRGGEIVSASVDGMARRWTLPEGAPAAPTLRHRGIIWNVAYSPGGERIVTASSDHTAQVWDARTGQPLLNAFQHTRDVYLARFSPDGQRVLTTSEGGTARVWDARTGDPITPPLRHSARIWVATFSPDGRRVATGSDDRTARVWDATSGLPISEPLAHPGPVVRLEFSPDGRRLLIFGGQPRVWDVIAAPAPAPAWFCDLVEAVAGFRLAADGQLLPVGPEAIATWRERLASGHPEDFYTRWAKWFLVDRLQEFPPSFPKE
jgi:eukaryotic-like serine/threonine-protein kinase